MPSREFPKNLIRKLEHENFPLVALAAVREAREYLDEVETEALPMAREMGASADDIAEALGITRQGAYYKFKVLDAKNGATSGRAKGAAVDVVSPDTESAGPEA